MGSHTCEGTAPDLGAEADDESAKAASWSAPGGTRVHPRTSSCCGAGEEQEAEQQGRPAHLAESECHPGRPGPASSRRRIADEHVEARPSGFPCEEEGEGVAGDQHDAAPPRAEADIRLRCRARVTRPAAGPSPEGKREIRTPSAADQCEEQPGQRIETNHRRRRPRGCCPRSMTRACRARARLRRGHRERSRAARPRRASSPDQAAGPPRREVDARPGRPDDQRGEQERCRSRRCASEWDQSRPQAGCRGAG